MANILVFSEKDDVAAELLSGAARLKGGGKVAALVIGRDAGARAANLFAYGADAIYAAEADFQPDVCVRLLCDIANGSGFDTVLLGSTQRGKELAGRVAQRIGAGCVTDAIGVEANDNGLLASRYSLGGNTVSSELVTTARKVVSVMPRVFPLAEKQARTGQVETVTVPAGAARVNLVERREKQGESVNIEQAERLVCVGRGLRQKEDVAVVQRLAKALKAELGCTRPLAYDLHWFPEERTVGLSGKKCKPALCIAVGISGQIQYTMGVRDAKVMVAINKDKNAPIFKMADYGIVGDLYQVVPRLTQAASAAG